MRLVAYLRVSSVGQVDAYGLDVQEAEVRSWARRHGHRIVRVYADAVSGAYGPEDRPDLSAALSDVELRVAGGLLVPRLDRLAREVTVQEAVLALVWRAGGSVFTADSGEVLRDDPDDPMRTAMRQMAGVFAGLERRMLVKRMRDGRRAKAASGRHAVGVYPFGYRAVGRGRTRDAGPDDQEQAAIARARELREEGLSYRAIALRLDAEGHRPRRAASWSAMAVQRICQRG